MFYSETLLSKTGPLAHVWLSANIERKLSKSNVLQSKIESDVNAIVNQGQAPLALRLSGHLLLGVVRIYSRKARYLLDDCNEAILKIKMAFRSGQVDLPANQARTANPQSLTLPDVLTEIDLLAPAPDPSLLLSQPFAPSFETDESALLNLDSTPHSQRSTQRSRAMSHDSIERGRDARPDRDDLDETGQIFPDDLEIDIGEDPIPDAPFEDSTVMPLGDAQSPTVPRPEPMEGVEDQTVLPMLDDDEFALPTIPGEPEAVRTNERRESSPLSSARSSVAREAERTFMAEATPAEELDEATIQQAQRAKRRKVLIADADTQIHSKQIREQQNDRSKILKSDFAINRDPMLQALLNMQKTGGLVSSILGDQRGRGWAPELRGILSLEVITQMKDPQRKRKHPSSSGADAANLLVADDEQDGAGGAGDVTEPLDAAAEGREDQQVAHATELEDEGFRVGENEEEPPLPDPGVDFEHTEMPLLHPGDSGPVSVGTKHAVHLLRDRFGADAADSPTKRQKSSVLFQDLLPESATTRVDATKMFFEVLVLATKDAIKVEQSSNELGAPLRVRGKRGLWGEWAESQAGGEIANQDSTAPAIS